MNVKLAATILGALALTGCFNGAFQPFQIDLKGTVDYPEGDPRRSDSQTAEASGSTTTDTASQSADPELAAYSGYDIPTGSVNVSASSVIQPRGTYPNMVEMNRLTSDAKQVAPETLYLGVMVVVARPGNSRVAPDGTWDVHIWGPGGVPNGADLETRPAVLTIKTFDGSFSKVYRQNTNERVYLDGLPIHKPLYMKAEVYDYKGYSLPIVLAASQRNINGAYLPIEFGVRVEREP